MGSLKHRVYIILFLIKAAHSEKLKVLKTADHKVLSEEYFISLKHTSDKPFPCNYPHKELLGSVLLKKSEKSLKLFSTLEPLQCQQYTLYRTLKISPQRSLIQLGSEE